MPGGTHDQVWQGDSGDFRGVRPHGDGLAGCDAKTVARYVAVREAGGDPLAKAGRPRLIDAFMPKVEELVDRSKGVARELLT